MGINQQKEIALNVFDLLTEIFPTAVLAGGAPRDWYLGIEAADLDFYVSDKLSPKQFLTILQTKFPNAYHKRGEKEAEYETMQSLKAVYQIDSFPMKVQIMLVEPYLTDGKAIVLDFAASVSECWTDITLNIQGTEAFFDSHKYKAFSYYKEAKKYVDKIKGKFSDYKQFSCRWDFKNYIRPMKQVEQ